MKLHITTIKERYSTSPWMRGRSRLDMETVISLPMPGRENMFSMIMLPPKISAVRSPSIVITGIREVPFWMENM